MAVRVYTGGASITVVDESPVVVPPPPPPPSGTAVVLSKPLVGLLVAAPGYISGSGAYDRFQMLQDVPRPDAAGTPLVARTFDGSAFPAGTVTLLCDGAALATASPSGSAATFTLTQAMHDALAEGWRSGSVSGAGVGTSLDYPMYIRKGATAAPHTTMPVCTGSYTLLMQTIGHNRAEGFQSAMVPAAFNPTLQPLPARAMPAFSTTPSRGMLVQTQVVPYRPEDGYRTAQSSSGVLTTANRQNYFDSDFAAIDPPWPLLDGPRGRGSVICPMAIVPSVRAGSQKLYVVEPWRIVRVSEDGTIATIFGQRHKGVPSFWGGPQDLEFVGTWGASVPTAQRIMPREMWDMAWVESSLGLNQTAPPIGGEQPHTVGPAAHVTDTKNNRVLRVTWSATVRDAPPVATVPIMGMNEPWGCCEANGVLYVSERAGGKVTAYDASYNVLWSVPIATAAGLRVQDGFLYVGSLTDKAVWKINVATRAVTKHIDIGSYFVNNNSRFVNVGISDGTFGPRGMIGVVTWSNVNYGYPNLFSPTGALIDNWQFGEGPRLGVPWAGGGEEQELSYTASVGFGPGSMTFGTAQEGLLRLSAALGTDVAPPSNYAAGLAKYRQRGLTLTHGVRGFGLYGMPVPRGLDADIDAYLTVNGH